MKDRTRMILTVVSANYLVVLIALAGRISWATFNPLLVLAAFPLVWLIWALVRWSANQHAKRWARDIAKVHGGPVVWDQAAMQERRVSR